MGNLLMFHNFARINMFHYDRRAYIVYGGMSVRQEVTRRSVLTEKCPHGEVSLQRSILTAKCHGDVSVRRSVRTKKCPTAKFPTAKSPTVKNLGTHEHTQGHTHTLTYTPIHSTTHQYTLGNQPATQKSALRTP